MNDESSKVSGRDVFFASAAIDRWSAKLPHTFSREQLHRETLTKEIVVAIRVAKKEAVEACGIAYYEVHTQDHDKSAVVMPILMDSRKVFIQFLDEQLSIAEMTDAVEKWQQVLRAKAEYDKHAAQVE